MISPTVGRMVHYYPNGAEGKTAGEQPLAAQVAFVTTDRLVNLGVLTPNGNSYGVSDVVLRQPEDAAPAGTVFCEWMPFQVESAKKAA